MQSQSEQSNRQSPSARKYYEEIIEERRQKRREIASITHEKTKRAFRKLHKDMNTVISFEKRENFGPLWYQELSNYQINILNNLQNHIKMDFEDGNTERVQHDLKEFGIKTKITHIDLKNAILCSKLYSIDFLKKIQEYLCHSINTISNETSEYTFEERLIISAIVHLGLPSLFLKLDYCLGDPVRVKKLNYMKKKQRPPEKYLSPYLEPFISYKKTWYENEKIKLLNQKVKSQKNRENLRENIIKDLKKNQENIIRDVQLKMNVSNPMHPLDALFAKIPLHSVFESIQFDKINNKEEMENTNNSDQKLESEFNLEIGNVVGEESLNDDKFKADYNEINNNKAVETENNTENVFKSEAEVQKSHSILSTKLSSGILNFSDDIIYDWQHLCMKNYSLNDLLTYKYEYKEVDEEPIIEETIEDEDFSFLINYLQENEDSENFAIIKELMPNVSRNHSNIGSSLYSANLNHQKLTQILEKSNVTKSMDKKLVVEKEHEKNVFENEYNITNSLCAANEREKLIAPIQKNSSMIKIMDKQSKIEDSMIRMFKNLINAYPEYRMHSLGVETTQQFNIQTINLNKNSEENVIKTIALEPKKSISVIRIELNSDMMDKPGSPDVDIVHDKVSNESESEQLEIKDENQTESHVYDEIIADIQQMPKWDQLRAALEFLAVLDDPVASLPNIIKLDTLLHWYESRLNINQLLTPERKAKLLDASKKLWKSPRLRIKDIPIPPNPCCKGHDCSKLTWDTKKTVLKQIEGTRKMYKNNVKELLLNSAREVYPTFQTTHYKNRLAREFKKTFHCYFSTKKDDVVLMSNVMKPKSKL